MLTKEIKRLVLNALKEDIGVRDITTEAIIPPDKTVKAVILTKDNCVICGLPIARAVFKTMNKKIKFRPLVNEGEYIKKGSVVVKIQGKARSVLTAERVALNFLGMLSGIATETKKYVDAVKPYKVKVLDTRKTIPLLRELQKYAVRVGGGYNHRMRLDEMLLIKDNHLATLHNETSILHLHHKWRGFTKCGVKLEIEVKNLREFKEALVARPDIIMLDNMNIADIKKAVQIKNYQLPNKVVGRGTKILSPKKARDLDTIGPLDNGLDYRLPKLEASGGINLKNVKRVAATGVDMISIGELTDSVKTVDLSLEIIE